jgi:hypothetical protein
MKSLLLSIMMTGTIDQIHDQFVVVEYRRHCNDEPRYMDVPIQIIPCKVSEGSLLTILYGEKIICQKKNRHPGEG